MSRVAGAAEIALAATRIDFTNHAPTGKRAITTLFHDTNKLVPNRSFKTRIAARDLEIGVANA
jgi:hypothetical protein